MIGLAAAAMLMGLGRGALLENASTQLELALRSNDVGVLEHLLSPEWIIIDSDGRPIDRRRFLAVIRSGELRHSEMRSSELQVRLFGDAAIEMVRADGQGIYRGQHFAFSERSTDFWTWTDGHWVCAMTQLTSIAQTEK